MRVGIERLGQADSPDWDPTKRLRATLDSLLDPHVLLLAIRDGHGEIVDFEYSDANPAACQDHQLSIEQLIGARLLDLRPMHQETGLFAMYKRVVESGEALVLDGFTYPLETGQGGDRLFDIRAVPLGDGLVTTWRDVTDRYSQFHAVGAAERRYRALASAATDVVYRTDSEGVIRWVSPSITRTLGWHPDDLVGRQITELADPADIGRYGRQRRQAYEGQLTWDPEAMVDMVVSVRCADGQYLRMSVVAIQDQDPPPGERPGLIVGLRDITELLATRETAAAATEESELNRMSMDTAMIGIAKADADGVFIYANPAMEHLLGYGAGDLVGRRFADITLPEDLADGLAGLAGLVSGETDSFRQRNRYVSRTGGIVWVELSVSAARDESGHLHHLLAQIVDVSAEMRANTALQNSVRRFRLLAENASDVVYQTDVDGVIQWISPSVSDVLGWDPQLLVGTEATALVAPEDLALLQEGRHSVFHGVREHGALAQFLTVRGGRMWMSVTAKPIIGKGDDVIGAVVSLRDVTSEQRVHQELALTQQRFRLAMDAAPQGMALTDSAGIVVDVNPAACRLLGAEARDVLGAALSEVLSAQAGDCTSDERHEHVRDTADGRIWIDHAASTLLGDDGKPVYQVHQFIDETSDRVWQRELEHRATHDVLTGVSNRGSLLNHLDHVLDLRRAMSDSPDFVGVLFCDVDNLKALNDTFGHVVGDAVLARVADRMDRSLRRGDEVGRIGGDEFVVVLDGIESHSEVRAVAEKIRIAIGAPMELDGQSVSATVSIGAALVEVNEDAESVLARADAALYGAKRSGRNCVRVAEPGSGSTERL